MVFYVTNLAAFKPEPAPEPDFYEVVWYGRLCFDVPAHSHKDAIRWVQESVDAFCAENNAVNLVRAYRADKVREC